jgi:DNA-binding IclR family transcriptional regulator/nitroimidazol reductase NimA-like FMN-containing flavoprotein (pyridoxamine 5'-phosphate oxidase superfamily)
VTATERTIRLIELILKNPEGITSSEAIAHLDASRSTVFAMLRTLKRLEYIDQPLERGPYKAGPRLLAWQRASASNFQDLVISFYHQAVNPDIDETLALGVPIQNEVLILAQIKSSHRVRSAYEIGERYTERECAAGPILTSKPSKNVRDRGYYLETKNDRVELSVPICIDGYQPDAALLVSAPCMRHTSSSIRSFLTTLRETAAHISYRMGAPIYAPYQAPPLSGLGPKLPLSEAEIDSFLDGPWPARLACIRPDGGPHVVPIWYQWKDNMFYVVAWQGSRWADYLLNNPQLSLSVDEPWPPLRRVSVRGKAQPLDEEDIPGGMSALLDHLSRRYLGHTLHPELANLDWRAFRIKLKHIAGWRGFQTS